MQKALVIVAGGVGSRMKADIPKQFISINSKPLIFYTIAAFLNIEDFEFSEIVIVSHNDYKDLLKNILTKYFPTYNFTLVAGGETRFHSCYNGLKAVEASKNKLVAIHDAARPLVSSQLIKKVFEQAALHQSAVPVVRLKDSLRVIEEGESKSKIVDRNLFRLVQTPQCFTHSQLLKAYENVLDKSKLKFTDDASVWEANYNNVFLCEGEANNIKVTQPLDLLTIEILLKENFNQ